jgi:two-component system, chemotaxis family, response regulator Rcp1
MKNRSLTFCTATAGEEKISGIAMISGSITDWGLASSSSPSPEKPRLETDAKEKRKHEKVLGLLVEDNRGDVFIIQEAIELYKLPIELYVVDDGQKAFDFVERAETDSTAPCPQILLLDLNLPKRSGHEVLERVRASETCKDISVIIISSSDSQKDRNEVAQFGVDLYFRKPSHYDEFLKIGEALKDLIQRKRLK